MIFYCFFDPKFYHPLQPDPAAKPNLNPIQTAPPKFVKSVKNGKLYTVGEGDDQICLVHVWGRQVSTVMSNQPGHQPVPSL